MSFHDVTTVTKIIIYFDIKERIEQILVAIEHLHQIGTKSKNVIGIKQLFFKDVLFFHGKGMIEAGRTSMSHYVMILGYRVALEGAKQNLGFQLLIEVKLVIRDLLCKFC